jgi:hypothetical protein
MALIGYLFNSVKPIYSEIRRDACTLVPWSMGVSRCNYKPDIFNHKLICNTVEEVLSSNCERLDWSECMDKKAIELHQLNSKIYLMWSGGIDSTGVLVSILKNWPKQDLERVTILLSRESIQEAGGLYSKLVFPNFKTLNSMVVDLEKLATDGYIVTGEPADQLFGFGQITRMLIKYGEDVILGDWKKYAGLYFASEKDKAVPPNYILENYIPLVDECPWKIKSYFEFLWWMNFSFKYQYTLTRFLSYGEWRDPKFFYSKLIHFYDTNEFNYWSINNVQKYLLDKDNKKVPKNYIIEVTKIDAYRKKSKKASLQNTWIGKKVNIAINDNWEFVDFNGVLNNVVQV